ncbi:MAG TPA: exodeoxyribonuclease V subunit gamma [Actinomycetales bacterium]|nr:exodeoxyribonuclease V subunit gamma [Actinomycetales bacterium]
MLHVHRSERTDALVGPLAAMLAVSPDDPFAPDVVAVPTKGVERWLAQRLSHHLGTGSDGEAGVCANVLFPSPTRLVSEVLSSVLGVDPADEPWRSEALTWTLLRVVDECAGEAWCHALGRHLGVTADGSDERRAGRRLAVARHLARLFTGYGAQRPTMVRDWAAGRDEDGAGAAVPDDLRWQPELWRRLRAEVGVPSPAERLEQALTALAAGPRDVELPARLSVFGPTRLPQDQLQVLDALGRHREVHLWLPHPSPDAWARARGGSEADGRAGAPTRRRELVPDVRHPLLASMARDALELQHRLEAYDVAQHHHPAVAPAATLLGSVQHQVRRDDPGSEPLAVSPADRSVQVHACHGRARQVEVLREVLVGLFADDPTLEPRDVLVMCPDIEAFAPLVAATFGLLPDSDGEGIHPGHTLRVRLADRSLRQTNPVLSLVATLLELADSRVTVSQVLDLASTPPVRHRFGLHDDDLERIRHWAVTSGVHWGEGPSRRERFGLAAVGQGTWQAGLDRLLLGAAMAEEDQRFVGPALPLDDVDSTDIELAGRLAELVDRLAHVLGRLDGHQPVTAWVEALEEGVGLLADTAPADAWQVVQARAVLERVREAAKARGQLLVRLPDVRSALADRLKGRPSRAGFRTGALTICSLEPMRSVPHRVVCLLGLDDGDFPRGARVDGDDVLLRDPCVGERDPRSEDRQLLLDALMSAEQTFVVLYSGADERTGAVRPPAVPVSELLDAFDAADPTHRARERVVVRHPLAAVDERNFVRGALGRPGPFSFDGAAHEAAAAGRAARLPRQPFLGRPLPPEPRPDEIDLDDLVAALEHPVRWFLRRRLQLSFFDEHEEVDDRLPLELSGLDTWQVGDRLLDACLAGADRAQAMAAEWRRGEVPPRELGRSVLEQVVAKVQPLAAAAGAVAQGEPQVVDLRADLPSGAVVTGTVRGVHGDLVLRTVYSRLAPKHRLRAWVQLLALVTSQPERPWQAMTIGRPAGSRTAAMVSRLSTPDPARAGQWLEQLVRLRAKALREPLPLPIAASCSYATSRFGGDAEVQALQNARQEWHAGFERTDEAHVTCWGDAELDDLLGTPLTDERLWFPDESRFGVLARRVWDVLLGHETVTSA